MFQAEEHSVTELQTKAQPNKAILKKLREEMIKLYIKQVTVDSGLCRVCSLLLTGKYNKGKKAVVYTYC